MTDLQAYGWVVIGVVLAVVFPVVRAYIIKEFPPVAGGLPPWLKRYLALLFFGLIAGVITLAIWKSQNPSAPIAWYTAFLIGFGWQSAIDMFFRPRP